MKEKLTRNTGLKILSLLLAVLLWIVIVNMKDPVMEETFKNIEVTVINDESLEEKGKVYKILAGETIDVKVKGKRSIIESIKISDFRAVADLSMLSITDVANTEVTIPRYRNDVEILNTGSYNLKLRLENLATQKFRVNIVERGTAAEGYYIKEKIARPNMIQVSGAESVINTIEDVVIEVDVTNLSEGLRVTRTPKVYDKNGAIIDTKKLQLNYSEVEVFVKLLRTKEVNLYIQVGGEPAYGYKYGAVEYEPKVVTIAGEEEALNKISYISGESIFNNKREDFEEDVDIRNFIKDEDIILIDDNETAALSVKVEPLDSKEINFNIDDIDVMNVPEGYEVEFNGETDFDLRVYGEESSLNRINRYNISPYIDLDNLLGNTANMEIQFKISDMNLLYSSPHINLNLVEVEDEN